MTTPVHTEAMSVEQSAALADFARTCKAAARSVSLYPATHPAIQGAPTGFTVISFCPTPFSFSI